MSPVELLSFCADNASDIFVRDELNGKWDAYALSDLPVDRALRWVALWIHEGRSAPVVRTHPERSREP